MRHVRPCKRLTDNIRLEDTRGGIQRVNGRIDALLDNLTGEDGLGVQVGKRGRRSRVGQVIRRNVDRLHGRDCAVLGGGDTLLQSTDLISQRRLVADRRGHAAHQCGNLRACLYIAENIVDKQQHVLLFHIAEVFRHGQTGQCNAHTRSGRFVHLAEHERGLAQYAGFRHLAPQVVALAGALSHARENGIAAVLGGDVADQLLDEHSLSHAGAAKQAILPPLA